MFINDHTAFSFQNDTQGMTQSNQNFKSYQFALSVVHNGVPHRCTPWLRCTEYLNEYYAWGYNRVEWDEGEYGVRKSHEVWEQHSIDDVRAMYAHPGKAVELRRIIPRVVNGIVSNLFGRRLAPLQKLDASVAVPTPQHWQHPGLWGNNEPTYKMRAALLRADYPWIFSSQIRMAAFFKAMRYPEWGLSDQLLTALKGGIVDDELAKEMLMGLSAKMSSGLQDSAWARMILSAATTGHDPIESIGYLREAETRDLDEDKWWKAACVHSYGLGIATKAVSGASV